MNLKLSALLGVLGSLLLAASASAASGGSCESLRSMAIPNVTIAAVDVVTPPPPSTGRGGAAAAAPAGPALPEYCRVRLLLTPSSDSHINAELWMPTATWNGRFMAVGNGGFGGSIQGFAEMQNALRLGYATSGNDTGHDNDVDGPNGMFALGHPEKIVDFAYRAMHEMTVTSKTTHHAVLRPAAAVLVLQGLFDRRAPGRDERAALSRRLRRHHRRARWPTGTSRCTRRAPRAVSSWPGIPRVRFRRRRRKW